MPTIYDRHHFYQLVATNFQSIDDDGDVVLYVDPSVAFVGIGTSAQEGSEKLNVTGSAIIDVLTCPSLADSAGETGESGQVATAQGDGTWLWAAIPE